MAILTLNFTLLSNAQTPHQTVNESLLQFEWPAFGSDASNTRFASGPAPSTANIVWKANITDIRSFIAAFNGMVFACSNTSVIALDGETGTRLWETEIPMTGTWPIAYKLDTEHMLVEGTCLDPQTGDILWTSSSFSTDTGNFNLNVYSPEEKMFYIKNLSYVEAWDFSDLTKPPTFAWKTYVPGSGRVGTGVTYGDGKVFPGSFQDLQMAIDAKTGDVLWTTRTKTPMIFNGAYHDGKFIRGGTDDNTMYCFNATTGDILWTYGPGTDGYFTIGCAIAYGMVYEPNKDGKIYALDVETGDLVWSYQGPGTMLFPGMPSVADGKVYVTSGQDATFFDDVTGSEFVCLNAYTGEVLWKLQMEAFAPRESIAIAYGKLFMIPGDVTMAVDSYSGSEYTTKGQVWAFSDDLSQITNDSWSMFRSDAVRSSIGNAGPENLTRVWKYTTEGAVMSSPSVVDGVLYAGSQDMNVYAVDAWSGSLIWKFATGGTIESSPAVVGGKVFIGSDDGYLYCLNSSSGGLVWKQNVHSDLPITSGAAVMLRSSPAVLGNIVYVGSVDGNLYALDVDNGDVLWAFDTTGIITSSPTLAGGFVYVTSEEPAEGALYKLSAGDGSLVWRLPLEYEHQFTGGTDMQGTPTVADGLVFVSANMRTYFGVDVASGSVIWNYTNKDATEFIVSSPIYFEGKLYVIDKFDIACLNASTGEKLWSSFSGDELYVSPSYADNKIYVTTSQRRIFIIDASTGDKTLAFTTPSASWSSPTLVDGRLYIGNNDWNIYCLSTAYISQSADNEEPEPTDNEPPQTNDDPLPNGDPQPETEDYSFYLFVGGPTALAIVLAAVYAYYRRRKN
ncbi:MAG: hypothetical protein CW716_00015 [Candidatus Bathyarchaeum sp.]|nr:MAG: hypothetical protein CW716_00015 [Candidatus Bathyarchaeum sp.]